MSEKRLQDLQDHVRRELPHLPEDHVRELAGIVDRLVAAFRPERIYVFGSQARGTPTRDSDFDLMVVVESAQEPAYRLAQAAYHVIGPKEISLDILFMTREEFERRSRARSSLPATILREGRTLYAA